LTWPLSTDVRGTVKHPRFQPYTVDHDYTCVRDYVIDSEYVKRKMYC